MKTILILTTIFILFLQIPCYCGDWQYNESFDKMRNQTTKSAKIKSTNSLNLSFPYNGGSTAILSVRKRSNKDKSILLGVTKGQFYCFNNLDCPITVKFDDKLIETFKAVVSEGNDRSIIFIEPYDRFIKQLKKAKQLTIEATFYQDGRKQMEFDVSGLEWN